MRQVNAIRWQFRHAVFVVGIAFWAEIVQITMLTGCHFDVWVLSALLCQDCLRHRHGCHEAFLFHSPSDVPVVAKRQHKTVLVVLVLNSSCFDILEEINLKKDGSGTMLMTINMSKSKTKKKLKQKD